MALSAASLCWSSIEAQVSPAIMPSAALGTASDQATLCFVSAFLISYYSQSYQQVCVLYYSRLLIIFIQSFSTAIFLLVQQWFARLVC